MINRRGLLTSALGYSLCGLPNVARSREVTFSLGVGAHLWRSSPNDIVTILNKVVEANLTMIRWDAPWKAVELEAGKFELPQNWKFIFEECKRRGILPIVILDYGNPLYDEGDKPRSASALKGYENYCRFMAKQFGTSVGYFEIWNEWDQRTGSTTIGQPAEYITLARTAHTAIKSEVPSCKILVGALSAQSYISDIDQKSYFSQLLDMGVLKFGDGVSIHPYVVSMPPIYRDKLKLEAYFKSIKDLITANQYCHPDQVIYLTEYGWPTGKAGRQFISEEEQADLLTQAIGIAESLQFDGLLIYEIRDSGGISDDAEAHYGILNKNWTSKLAFNRIKGLSRAPE